MKLRQKLTIGLCAFYLITIIGLALNMHFCGGRLADVSFTETAKCGMCKMAEKKGKDSDCCKNTSIDAKVKDSHTAGVKISLAHDFGIELFLGPSFTEISHELSSSVSSYALNKAPPLSARLSLHLFNCVFRN
jgi:hypothetical protein